MPLRLVFMGTPDFAVATLGEILGAGHEVVAVYTQPPRPAGRGMEPTPSPVEKLARSAGIPVFTPTTLKTADEQQRLVDLAPDAIVVVAYGMLLPQAVLDIPPLGCLNLHGSLLPRWRGAAPIQRAIMAGDAGTGVMVMKMEAGLDTGPVAMVERLAIAPEMTAGELHDALAPLGADLMHRALGALERGGLSFRAQSEEGATYARKIEKQESRIDWSRPAKEVHDHIRGLSPFPGAWFELGKDRIKVLRSALVEGTGAAGEVLAGDLVIACGSGAVQLVSVQKAGKGALDAAAFLRGTQVPVGTRLA